MKPSLIAVIGLQAGLAATAASQDLVTETVRSQVQAEVRSALEAEQAAFAAADCNVVMSYFADWEPLFVVGGRTLTRARLGQMCARMTGSRPGPPREVVSHAIHVLSPDAAFSVTNYTVQRPGPDGTRSPAPQVVTKVWARLDGGWRIVHLHESVAGG